MQFNLIVKSFQEYTMEKILIKGGTVTDGAGERVCDLLIEGGRIAKLQSSIEQSGARVIDARGLHVFPGFFDIHCHLREPGFEYKEDIQSGTLAAAAGGFTSICCMPNTSPVTDNKVVVRYILSRAAECCGVNVYPIAAVTKGQGGTELTPFASLKAAGAVALSDDGLPVASASMMRLAMEYAKPLALPIISHCEDMSLAEGGCANEGASATAAGLKGISRASEEIMVARDIILSQTLNAPVHIAHISTRGSAHLVREAKSRGVKVTCETCPHYFSIDDRAITEYDTGAKVNPPLRTEDDVLAIKLAIADGTIDAIATDHAPHSEEEKAQEFALAPNGISGFETAFALSYTNLVQGNVIGLSKLIHLLTAGPARIMNMETGMLREGAPADIAVADLSERWTVDPQKFLSRGKNTPFGGAQLQGRILLTLAGGKTVYQRQRSSGSVSE